TDFDSSEDEARSIALQGDKIIVAGYTTKPDFTTGFALARYTADGRLDSSFGEQGKVTTDLNGNGGANAIALQGDKIIVAGNVSNTVDFNNDFALARYN